MIPMLGCLIGAALAEAPGRGALLVANKGHESLGIVDVYSGKQWQLCQKAAAAAAGQWSRSTSTSPGPAAVSPSQISMVVAFPAPLGPSSPKHSPGRTFQIEIVHRDHVLVSLAKLAHAKGGLRGGLGLRNSMAETRAFSSWLLALRARGCRSSG